MSYEYSAYVFSKQNNEFIPITQTQEEISYNDLQNQPIVNLTGTVDECVIIGSLAPGRYSVADKYKLDAESQLNTADSTILFWVTEDTESSHTFAVYRTMEGGEYVVNLVEFVDGLVVNTQRISWNSQTLSNINNSLSTLQDAVETLNGGESVSNSVRNIIKQYIDQLESDMDDTHEQMDQAISQVSSDVADVAQNLAELDSSLSNVAKSGTASDVALVDAGGKYASTNVEQALSEVVDKIANNAVILDYDSSQYKYVIYQGAKDSAHKVGEISIPNDMVATSGTLYVATSSDSGLVAGETYIKMTVANGEPFFIPVQGLVDIYQGANTSTGISIVVDNGTISAVVKSLDGSKLDPKSVPKSALANGVQDTLNLIESAVQSVSEGSQPGTIDVDGTNVSVHGLGSAAFVNTDSFDAAGTAQQMKAEVIGNQNDSQDTKTIEGVLKKITNVVESLDSSAVVATKSGDVVTIKAGISQDNGVISNNGNQDIVLSKVASTGSANDIGITDEDNLIAATNLEDALEEIMSTVNSIADRLTWRDRN